MFLLFPLSLLLTGWGYTGHAKISYQVILSLPEEMSAFQHWVFYLSEHASDADKRKQWDPDEAPRHYIDIDNYPEFMEDGRIASTIDSLETTHGAAFVRDNGYLPWAILGTYDSLVYYFTMEDWEQAMRVAADLGHYVADAHMPLHLTRNYNGQYSGNTGIHSRYESDMINRYIDQINYQGKEAEQIEDVRAYIFHMIYRNYVYVDSVLLADDYAKETAGNTYSDAYLQLLWERTGSFTIYLFENASQSFASLFYTAWKKAGSPSQATGVPNLNHGERTAGITVSPNPVTNQSVVTVNLQKACMVTLQIYDIRGSLIHTISPVHLNAGINVLKLPETNSPPGSVMVVVVITDEGTFTKKIIKSARE